MNENDGKVEIPINEKILNKAKRLGEKINKSADEVVEESLKRFIKKEEFEDRYFPDKESRDNYVEITKPFDKLMKTTKINMNILSGDYSAYQKFQQLSLISYIGFLQGKDSMFLNQLKRMKNNKENNQVSLISRIGNILENAKIFNLDEELVELINHTDTKPHYSKIPFRTIFINQELEPIQNVKIFGIGIFKADILDNKTKEVLEGLDMTFIGQDLRDNTEFYQYFQMTKKGIIGGDTSTFKEFSKEDAKKIEQVIANFITNILELLNHPEIEYEIVSHGLNENREKKGKLKINDKVNIVVKGKLYRYIYETLPRQQKSYTHRFWIRGHFKHFRNQNRFCQIYKLSNEKIKEKGYQMSGSIICKWVLPYIKGRGSLIKKEYNLKKK